MDASARMPSQECSHSPWRTHSQALKSKELALLMWALAWCSHHDDGLFDAAPAVLLAHLRQGLLSWHDIAHVTWSLSTTGR